MNLNNITPLVPDVNSDISSTTENPGSTIFPIAPLSEEPAKIDKSVKFLSANELLADKSPSESLVEGLIPSVGLIWLFGLWGHYKSFIALLLSICVALGIPWCGRKTKQGRVVYLLGEGYPKFRYRLAALLAGMKLTEQHPIPILISEKGIRLDEDGFQAFTDYLDTIQDKIRLVVIDTQARCQVGDENSNTESGYFVDQLTLISERYQCAVLIVHHTGKNGKDMRGAGNYAASADAVLRVKKEEKDGKRFAVISTDKVKDGDDNQKFCLEGKLMELPGEWRTETGERVSSLYFAPVDLQDQRKADLRNTILSIVREHPKASQSLLKEMIRDQTKLGVNSASSYLDTLAEAGHLHVDWGGPGTPKKYSIAPDPTEDWRPATDTAEDCPS